ncbi:MAG: hypothetical protein IKS05_00575 [Oscillospiraceae bacterium]|nr:hypothetical protein [Oscillospiraceae bacterium]
MKIQRFIYMLLSLFFLLFMLAACGKEESREEPPASAAFSGSGYLLRGTKGSSPVPAGKESDLVELIVIAEDSEYFKKGTVVVLEESKELSSSFADGEKVQFGCDQILESNPPVAKVLWIQKADSFSYSLEKAKVAAEQTGFVLDQ